MSRVIRVFVLTAVLIVSSVTFFEPTTASAEDSGTSRVTCDATFSKGPDGFQQVVALTNCESAEDNWIHVVQVLAGGTGALIALALILWFLK